MRGMQQHPFAGINPPLLVLVWSHPYHWFGKGSASYYILQWQFQMFNCKTQGRLAQPHMCQPWESTRMPAEQLGWEAGGMAEMILIRHCRIDTVMAWILMWEFLNSLLGILLQELVKIQGDTGAWSIKKDEEERLKIFCHCWLHFVWTQDLTGQTKRESALLRLSCERYLIQNHYKNTKSSLTTV